MEKLRYDESSSTTDSDSNDDDEDNDSGSEGMVIDEDDELDISSKTIASTSSPFTKSQSTIIQMSTSLKSPSAAIISSSVKPLKPAQSSTKSQASFKSPTDPIKPSSSNKSSQPSSKSSTPNLKKPSTKRPLPSKSSSKSPTLTPKSTKLPVNSPSAPLQHKKSSLSKAKKVKTNPSQKKTGSKQMKTPKVVKPQKDGPKASEVIDTSINKESSIKFTNEEDSVSTASAVHTPVGIVSPSSGNKNSSNSKKKQASTRNLMLTGRGVTTQMLIQQQILEPGEKCLSINYLGNKFVGDLITDGTIKCHSADQIFSSPSAWAMHCKKQVNPDKKSGCGWASVKYKGRKLDEFKSTWFRKQKIEQQVAESSDSMASSPFEEYSYKTSSKRSTNSESNNRKTTASHSYDYVPPTENYVTFSEALKAVQSRQAGPSYTSRMRSEPFVHSSLHQASIYADSQQKIRKRTSRTRISVKHSLLQPNSDPTTLVECSQFTTTGKIQPFSMTISTSAMLLINELLGLQQRRILKADAIPTLFSHSGKPCVKRKSSERRVEISEKRQDFHCHLSVAEVSGYLAGKWDLNRQHIRITQAFPCRYMSNSSDMEVNKVETEIRSVIESKGLNVLGWYHSHPFCQPDPSIRDIRAQLEYQKAVKDGHYEPCVGLVVSPYDSHRKESQFNAFWVREPTDGKALSIGLPLLIKFTTHQDQSLTQDLVNEMVALVNYHQGTMDCVKFSDIWTADSSYLDKLKHSVIRKFPQDQTDGRFLDFIHKMLMAVCS